MNTKAILIGGVSVSALCGVMFAFLTNASPYVTIEEARKSTADNLHVIGEVDKATVQLASLQRECRFVMTDETGQSLQIISTDLPSNLAEADQVVAIGGMKGDHFQARQLLVKCPSKYQGQESKASRS